MSLIGYGKLVLATAITFLVQHSSATPILLYHSLEELSEHALNSLPSTAGIHWVLGDKKHKIAADKISTTGADTAVLPLQGRGYAPVAQATPSASWYDECNAKAQMFSRVAQQKPKTITVVVIVLILINIPITALLWLAARRLSRVKDSVTPERHRLHRDSPAAMGTKAFAEEKLKTFDDAKTTSSSVRCDEISPRARPTWTCTLRRSSLLLVTSSLYVCSWGAVLLAPFGIEAFTVCNFGHEPSTSLLAGLWAGYAVFDIAFLLASTWYLLHAIVEALGAQRRRGQLWHGSRQTLLNEQGRADGTLGLKHSATTLPVFYSDASQSFMSPDELIRARGRNSGEPGREGEQLRVQPRTPSPAASSYYGPRRSCATTHASYNGPIEEAWRELAERAGYSPHGRE